MDENNQENVTKDDNNEAAPSDPAVAAAVPTGTGAAAGKALFEGKGMDFINEVSMVLSIEVGRTQIKIRDLLSLAKDSIIDLNKAAGEPVDIYANGKLISRGNIITVNGKYCVRLTSIAQPATEKAE